MKCASGDKEDMVGTDVAIARLDSGTFNDRQEIALHPFSRHIGTGGVLLAVDLVDLIDEYDSVILYSIECFIDRFIHVHQLAQLFILQNAPRFGNAGAASLLLLGERL